MSESIDQINQRLTAASTGLQDALTALDPTSATYQTDFNRIIQGQAAYEQAIRNLGGQLTDPTATDWSGAIYAAARTAMVG